MVSFPRIVTNSIAIYDKGWPANWASRAFRSALPITFSLVATLCWGETPLKFGTAPVVLQVWPELQSDINQALSQLGYNVEWVIRPAKRLTIESRLGRFDGEAARLADYAEYVPNMNRIPTPVSQEVLVIFTRTELNITSIEQFSQFRMAGVASILVSDVVRQKTTPLEYHTYSTFESAFKQLRVNRADYTFYPRQQGIFLLEKLSLQNHVKATDLEIAQVYFYLWLDERHSHLIEPLDQIIQQMTEQGLFTARRYSNP